MFSPVPIPVTTAFPFTTPPGKTWLMCVCLGCYAVWIGQWKTLVLSSTGKKVRGSERFVPSFFAFFTLTRILEEPDGTCLPLQQKHCLLLQEKAPWHSLLSGLRMVCALIVDYISLVASKPVSINNVLQPAVTTCDTFSGWSWISTSRALGNAKRKLIELCSPVTRQGVTNLLVDDETTYSLQVSWEIDDADVEQYKVTYNSQRGDRAEESVRSQTHAHTHIHTDTHNIYRS